MVMGQRGLTYITAAGGRAGIDLTYTTMLVWFIVNSIVSSMWSIRQSSDHCFVAVDAQVCKLRMCEMLAVSVVPKMSHFL